MLCGDSYKDGMKHNVCGQLMEHAFRLVLGKRGGGVGEGCWQGLEDSERLNRYLFISRII